MIPRRTALIATLAALFIAALPLAAQGYGGDVRLYTKTVTIADGQSLSASLSLGGMDLVGVMVPASNWAAAALTFQGSLDGTTWVNVFDDSGEYATGSLANGQACSLVREVFFPWKYLKVRSGTSGAAVVQADGDTITLILRTPR